MEILLWFQLLFIYISIAFIIIVNQGPTLSPVCICIFIEWMGFTLIWAETSHSLLLGGLFRLSSHSSKCEIFTRNSYSQLQVLNQSVANFSSAANSFPTISTSSFYTFSSKFREVFPILPMNRGPRYVLCIIWKNYLLIQCLFRNLTPNTRSTFYNEFKFTSISHSLGLLSSVVATLNFLTRRDSSQPTLFFPSSYWTSS